MDVENIDPNFKIPERASELESALNHSYAINKRLKESLEHVF